MPENLLSITGGGINLGDRWLFRHVDITISTGDRIALVGRNGAGKSTLLKMLAGLGEMDEGSVWQAPATNITYLPQAPDLPSGMSLASIVQHGTGSDGDSVIPLYQAEAMLTYMKMDPGQMTDGLSGGESRRVALARALVQKPDILLLDEPTNHLDLPTITWMEEMLLARGGAMIIISHDRAFLRNTSNATLWIDGQKIRRRQGDFSGFDDWAEAIQAEEAVRLYKMDRKIAEETRWSQAGISARRKRNQGRLRGLDELRAERARTTAPMSRNMQMETSSIKQGGQMVLEAINLSKSVPKNRSDKQAQDMDNPDARRVLFQHWNGLIRDGDRIGIIGANGIGKSTLVRVLLGMAVPDSGRVREGFGIIPAYFDQQRTALNGEDTPWTTLCPTGGDVVEVAGKTIHVKKYLQNFLFDAYKITQRVRTLSGGEQNRLLLAKLFASKHNFLVLDEPTNDLDIETLELLQEVIADYDGTVLIISHDRDFIDRTVTTTLAFEGDGKIIPHAGGYSDYLARRIKTETKKKTKEKSKSKERRDTSARTQKLTFKDKHALESLPLEIAALEKAIGKAEIMLADTTLFSRNADEFNHIAMKLEIDKKNLREKEDLWLDLEEKRLKIEEAD